MASERSGLPQTLACSRRPWRRRSTPCTLWFGARYLLAESCVALSNSAISPLELIEKVTLRDSRRAARIGGGRTEIADRDVVDQGVFQEIVPVGVLHDRPGHRLAGAEPCRDRVCPWLWMQHENGVPQRPWPLDRIVGKMALILDELGQPPSRFVKVVQGVLFDPKQLDGPHPVRGLEDL